MRHGSNSTNGQEKPRAAKAWQNTATTLSRSRSIPHNTKGADAPLSIDIASDLGLPA